MKKEKLDSAQEVKTLLNDAILEEAVLRVKEQFDEAWSQLDPQSATLLGQHFDGVPISELSEKHHLSEEQLQRWIDAKKKELVQLIKRNFQARH